MRDKVTLICIKAPLGRTMGHAGTIKDVSHLREYGLYTCDEWVWLWYGENKNIPVMDEKNRSEFYVTKKYFKKLTEYRNDKIDNILRNEEVRNEKY